MENSELKQRILEYIITHSGEGVPAVREICTALSVNSTSTVHRYLHLLQQEGAITIQPGKRRNIALASRQGATVVPIIGTVAAGVPILAAQNIEGYLPFGGSTAGEDELFALNVRGDSMKDAGILNGDYVVARRTQTANNGEIVVALLGEEATVKKLYRTADTVELRPCNPAYAPIVSDNIKILGCVVGVLRYY